LNTTSEEDVEKRLGLGRVTIGFHSNSAREWKLRGGGYFTVDGAFSDTKQTDTSRPAYIVDHVLWTTDGKRNDALLPGSPTCSGLGLGTSKGEAWRIFGQPTRLSVTHYDMDCSEWEFGSGKNKERIDIAFKQGKAALMSVDACHR
jgi:hypothetical protein